MLIYWLFLVMALLTWVAASFNYKIVNINGYSEKRYSGIMAFVFFAVVTFFCGLRSAIADTGAYILGFNEYPSSIDQIVWSEAGKGKGFYFLSVLYKQFISEDFHGWLFIIALVSCGAVILALRKYSCSFGFSCYLFIATTTFTYLINGIRQFICISIMFLLTSYIVEKKFFKYIFWVLVLSLIHSSTLIMIPIYFIVKIKPFSGKTWLLIIGSLILGLSFSKLTPLMGAMLEDTSYSAYADLMASGTGVNIIRVALAAVPLVLAFMGRHIIERRNNQIIKVATNMSIITFCLYIIAMFTNGMAVGRLLAFFEIYNIILIPWLVENIFEEKSRKLITILCVLFYLVFFYFQMVITWNIGYESDILHLFI